jgi:CubicO group peptidase (beta-lactamase class C family)
LYAPTGRCTIRNYNLQGEVNDQNTYALGGVSSHAGLFGSVDDVSWFGLFIRSHLLKQAHTFFKNKTIETFTKRAIPESQGDWALGFMLPTPGLASSGIFFSRESIGHTGFTGTSIWYDPRQDLLVTILSNRVAFGVDHQGFKEFRPKIHDWIVEGLKNL